MSIVAYNYEPERLEFDIYEKIPANLAYRGNNIRYPIIKGIIAKKCDYKFIQETALWQFTIHTLFIIYKGPIPDVIP